MRHLVECFSGVEWQGSTVVESVGKSCIGLCGGNGTERGIQHKKRQLRTSTHSPKVLT